MSNNLNKWKIAFFATLSVSIATVGFLVYFILDQSVTFSYMADGYDQTKNSLSLLADAYPKDRYKKKDVVVVLTRIDPNGFIVESECSVQTSGLRFEFNRGGDLIHITTQAEYASEYTCSDT